MSDTGKKSYGTLYNGDQRSSQKFLAIRVVPRVNDCITPLRMIFVIGLPELTLATALTDDPPYRYANHN